MWVEVNGERRNVAPQTTVSSLLAALDLADGPVAVERNQAIVPRAKHGETQLEQGDRLEIVHFVGGG